MKNLDEVKYLEMKVDTRDNSLGNFGKNYLFISVAYATGTLSPGCAK